MSSFTFKAGSIWFGWRRKKEEDEEKMSRKEIAIIVAHEVMNDVGEERGDGKE